MSYKSTLKNPDLDWSQIRETVVMLNVSMALIDFTLNQGEDSVSTLSNSFTSMATLLSDIDKTLQEKGEDFDDAFKTSIHCQIEEVKGMVNTAIVAFQFYDRLSQRLHHVTTSLNSLGELVSNPTRLYSPMEWNDLHEDIKSLYSMEEERLIHESITSGETLPQVIERLKSFASQASEPSEEIELF